MAQQVDVFNDGLSFIRLVNWVGDELAIVNAARVSFHNEAELEQIDTGEEDIDGRKVFKYVLSEKDKGLINFLLKNKHGSPFEQGFMSQWHIRLPIFVMREWARHRVGFSINEESGRYIEMRPDFYYPSKLRSQKGKPGNYWFEPIENEELTVAFRNVLSEHCGLAYLYYKNALAQGIAKEQARILLPLNLYTEIRWTANARSLMNFLALRNAPNAMYEIKRYAEEIEKIFAEKMPNTYKAFIEAARVAP